MKKAARRLISLLLCFAMLMSFAVPSLNGTTASAISVGVNPTPAIDIAVNIPDDYPGDFEMFREEMTKKLAEQLASLLDISEEQAKTLFRITNTAAVIDTTDLEGWYVYDHYYSLDAYNAILNKYKKPADQKLKQPYLAADNSKQSAKVYSTLPNLIQDVFLNSDGTSRAGVGTTLYPFNQHTYSWVNEKTGAASMIFAGYGTNALWDFMAYPEDKENRRTIEFDLDCGAVDTHTLAGAGFLLNASITDAANYQSVGKLNGYGLYLKWSGTNVIPYIIKFNNYTPSSTGTMTGYDTTATGVTLSNMVTGTKVRFSVVITENSTTILMRRYTNGVLGEAQNIFGGATQSNSTGAETAKTNINYAVSLPDSPGGAFGPFVNYTSHACSSMTYFTFGDLQMGVGRTAFDALKNVQYYQLAQQKYFINLSSPSEGPNIPDDTNDKQMQSYIDGIQRMDTEEIFYISDEDDHNILHATTDNPDHKSLTGKCNSKQNEFCHLGDTEENAHTQANGYYATQEEANASNGLDQYDLMAKYIAENYANNVPFYHGEVTSDIPLANFYITDTSAVKYKEDGSYETGKVSQLMTVHLQHYKDAYGRDKESGLALDSADREDRIVVNIADKSVPNKDGDTIDTWELRVIGPDGNYMDKYGGEENPLKAEGGLGTGYKMVDGVKQPIFKYTTNCTAGNSGEVFPGFLLSYGAYVGEDGIPNTQDDQLTAGRYTLELTVSSKTSAGVVKSSSVFQTYLTIFLDDQPPEGTITNTAKNQINIHLEDKGQGIDDDGITFIEDNRGSGVYAYYIQHVKPGTQFTKVTTADDERWEYLSAPTHEYDIPINLTEVGPQGEKFESGDVIYIYYKDECDNIGVYQVGKLIEVEVQDVEGNTLDDYLIIGNYEEPDPDPDDEHSDEHSGDIEFGWLPDDIPAPPDDYPDDSEFSNWVQPDDPTVPDDPEGNNKRDDVTEGTVVPDPKEEDDDKIIIRPSYSNDTVKFYFHANATDATVNKNADNIADPDKSAAGNAAEVYNVPLGASVSNKASTLKADPVRTGYTFLYWSLEKGNQTTDPIQLGNKIGKETVDGNILKPGDNDYEAAGGNGTDNVIKDVTNNHVYAQWQVNSHKLYFDRNGGISGGPASRTVAYGKNLWTDVVNNYGLMDKNNPVRPGYEFAGWALTKEDADKSSSYSTVAAAKAALSISATNTMMMPDSDYTLYAIWVPDNSSIRLHFYSNGGTEVSSKVYKASDFTTGTDKPFEYLAAPTREGYEFAGWYWFGKGNAAPDTTKFYRDKDDIYNFIGKNAITEGAEDTEHRPGDKDYKPNADPKPMNSDDFLGTTISEATSGDYWLVAKWEPMDSTITLKYAYNTGYEDTSTGHVDGGIETGTDGKYYLYETIDAKTMTATIKTETDLSYEDLVEADNATTGVSGNNSLIGKYWNWERTWKGKVNNTPKQNYMSSTEPTDEEREWLAYKLWDSNTSHFTDPTRNSLTFSNNGKATVDGDVKVPNFTIVPDAVTSSTGSIYWYDKANTENAKNIEDGFGEAQPNKTITLYYDRLYNISADVQTIPKSGNVPVNTAGEVITDESGRLWTPTGSSSSEAPGTSGDEPGEEPGDESDETETETGIIGTISPTPDNNNKLGGQVSIEATTGALDAIYQTVKKGDVQQNAVLAKFGRSITVSWEAKTGYYVSAILVDGVSQGSWITDPYTGSYTFGAEALGEGYNSDGVGLNANHHIVVVFKEGDAPSTDANVTITAKFEGNYDGSCFFTVGKPYDDVSNPTHRQSVKDKVTYNDSYDIYWKLGDGYTLKNVIVDGVSLGATKSDGRNDDVDRTDYGFQNVKNDHDVIVVVEKLPTNGGSATLGYYTVTVNVYGGDSNVKTTPSAVVEQGNKYRVNWDATQSEWDVFRVEVNGKEVLDANTDQSGVAEADKKPTLPALKNNLQNSYQTFDFSTLRANQVVDIYLSQRGTEGTPNYSGDEYVRLITVLEGGPGTISGGNIYRLKNETDAEGNPINPPRTDKQTVTWEVTNSAYSVKDVVVEVWNATTKKWETAPASSYSYNPTTNKVEFADGLTKDTRVTVTLVANMHKVTVLGYGKGTVSGSMNVLDGESYIPITGNPADNYGVAKVTVQKEGEEVQTIYPVEPSDEDEDDDDEDEDDDQSAAVDGIALAAADTDEHIKEDKTSATKAEFNLVDIRANYTVKIYFTEYEEPKGDGEGESDKKLKDVDPDIDNDTFVVDGETNLKDVKLEGTRGGVTNEDRVVLEWNAGNVYDYTGATISIKDENGNVIDTYTVVKDSNGNYKVYNDKGEEMSNIEITIDEQGNGTITITNVEQNMYVYVELDLENNTPKPSNDQHGLYNITAEVVEGEEGAGTLDGNFQYESGQQGKVTWDTKSDITEDAPGESGKTRRKYETRKVKIDGRDYDMDDLLKQLTEGPAGHYSGYVDGVYFELDTEEFYLTEDIEDVKKAAGEKFDADTAKQEEIKENTGNAWDSDTGSIKEETKKNHPEINEDDEDALKEAAIKDALKKAREDAQEQAVTDAMSDGSLKKHEFVTGGSITFTDDKDHDVDIYLYDPDNYTPKDDTPSGGGGGGGYTPPLNVDTDDDGEPDLNVDLDDDGIPDVSVDTDGDGIPDLDIDTDGDGEPDVNVDTDGDGEPDINIDTDGDGWPDVDIDRDGDGIPDVNVDTDGDGIPDFNVIPDGPNMLNTQDHVSYIAGYPDGSVGPDRNITRAEVAAIFYRLLDDDVRQQYRVLDNDFPDVALGKWYNSAISTMANMGVVSGYPNGTFQPDQSITRAEFISIVVRFYNFQDASGVNRFPDDDGHWAEKNINTGAALGVISGYPNGTFQPEGKITRAEAISIVNRMLNRKPHVRGIYDDTVYWTDNTNKNKWYYEDIQEASDTHDYDKNLRMRNALYENWTENRENPDWAALEKLWGTGKLSAEEEIQVIDLEDPDAIEIPEETETSQVPPEETPETMIPDEGTILPDAGTEEPENTVPPAAPEPTQAVAAPEELQVLTE